MREVQLREAKASFSAVVNAATEGEPALVTRHGEPVAVVLGYADWQLLTGQRTGFAEALLSFPEPDEVSRDPAPPRDIGA